jgi:NTP pyrophosphatase (non-canonical NTP hydrolase)
MTDRTFCITCGMELLFYPEKESLECVNCLNHGLPLPSPAEIHKLAIEKGWWIDQREVPELLCLVHSEISEGLEGYRLRKKPGEKGWLGEELADAIIRIYDMSAQLGIDINQEVVKKHEFNKTRPYRHGNKVC